MNPLPGQIVSVRVDGLMAEVVLTIGGQQDKSIVTAEAANELRLVEGGSVGALINPTSVMIMRDRGEERL
jgi:molybdopterin-binding protein